MKDDRSNRSEGPAPLAPQGGPSVPQRYDEPPVVARLMIEIRSDGSRTIARGALEDITLGEKVALEAHGTSPASLAASLIKSLFSAPLLARAVARRLLKGR